MAGWSALHMSLAMCLSSALTLLAILLLIRPGHENVVTYVIDQVRSSSYSPSHSPSYAPSSSTPPPKELPSPSSCPCGVQHHRPESTPWRQDLTPTTFVKHPWKHTVYGGTGGYYGGGSEQDFWAALLTPNGGFLDIDLQDGKNHSVGVSMFHQLHCLHMIREALLEKDEDHHIHEQQQRRRPGMTQRRMLVGNPQMKKKKKGHDHVLHCFDYLAQTSLCAADDAVEGYLVRFDDKGMETDPISGEGQVHQCRNATRLFEFVRESVQGPVPATLLGEHSVFPE